MMRAAATVALLFILACHSESESEQKSSQPKSPQGSAASDESAYLRDVDRFCFAERHAEALEIETAARGLVVADWLSRNLETKRARDFLASIQAQPPARKAELLNEQAKLAKLDACPTAEAWKRVARAAKAPAP